MVIIVITCMTDGNYCFILEQINKEIMEKPENDLNRSRCFNILGILLGISQVIS